MSQTSITVLYGNASTGDFLSQQWRNPTNVVSILSLIGGDVIQKALAQLSGCVLAPIGFSFGWVAYAFNTLVSVVGDGRLMPPPDYPAKVINIDTGYIRENRSWIIGRMLRDFSTPLENHVGLKITVFRAVAKEKRMCSGQDWIWWTGLLTIAIQVCISSIPFILYRDWGVFLSTLAGIVLALLTSGLPQWRYEKWACRSRSKKTICITGGNGTRYAMIIRCSGEGIDLEDLAASESPRLRSRGAGIHGRWHKKMRNQMGMFEKDEYGQYRTEVRMAFGYPAAYLVTQFACIILAGLWVVFLVMVFAFIENQWYIMAIGGIGTVQNIIAAGTKRPNATHGISLIEERTFQPGKVMRALMDLDSAYPKAGRPLLREYFSSDGLRPDEKLWWDARVQEKTQGSKDGPIQKNASERSLHGPKSCYIQISAGELDSSSQVGKQSRD